MMEKGVAYLVPEMDDRSVKSFLFVAMYPTAAMIPFATAQVAQRA
jgi:hypothetical protein